MQKKFFRFLTLICPLLFVFCFLFTSCEDASPDDDIVVNPGRIRAPDFSHDSGLYKEPFFLEISARSGNQVYYTIDGSIPDPRKAGNGRVFKYSGPILIQNRNGQPNLLATPDNSEKFYAHQFDPRGSWPAPYIPTNDQVPKATVIRAAAVDSSGTKISEAPVRTFFIGNNLANYANAPILSLVSDPYNLVDQNYGILVRGADINRWDGPNQYNFLRRGEEWERVASMEFFTGDANSRSLDLSANVGIRIRGGWSRDRGQKSFNVYFRSEYGGINTLTNYQLIPGAIRANGTPIGTYKSFMLRNGGNDTEQTKLYDVFIQNILSDRSFTTQAAVPCIVYINGEYWGFYNLQERYSDNHTEYKYGVNRNNVISFDNGALDDGNAGEESYYWNIMSFSNMSMNDNNYAEFCKLFDIQNFAEYWAAQIYINNQDWPHNNFRLWRTRNVEPGNIYGDTKLRWQMFDTEYALGIYDGGGVRDPFQVITNNGSQNGRLFEWLKENSDFRNRFINALMDLYNINFHPDKCIPELNRMADIYKPLMADYSERFSSWRSFDNNIDNARNYLRNIRSAMTENYLPAHFGNYGLNAGNLANVTLIASDGGTIPNASIKINTTTVNLGGGSWTGQYYSVIPITVSANVPNGYQFTGWTVTGGTAETPASPVTVINFDGNVTITANYTIPTGGITLGGNITLPNIDTSVNHVKLVLSSANSSWKREIDIVPSGNSFTWATTILQFANSTPISFRLEGYENKNSVDSLYKIDTGVSRNVHSASINDINIDLSGYEIIKLSGTISLAAHVPAKISHIGIQLLINNAVISQIIVPNSVNPSNWQLYVPAQTAHTPVTWNIYGFSNSSFWNQPNPIIKEDADVSASMIYNSSIAGINIVDFALTPAPLPLEIGNYNNNGAVLEMESLPNNEFLITVEAVGANRWDAAVSASYPGEAYIRYTYRFFARTAPGNGSRQMYIQYFWTSDTDSYGESILITENEREFIINGNYLPFSTEHGANLQFQCADMVGAFYLRDITITPNP